MQNLEDLIYQSIWKVDISKTIILRMNCKSEAALIYKNLGKATQILEDWALNANIQANSWRIEYPAFIYKIYMPDCSLNAESIKGMFGGQNYVWIQRKWQQWENA